MPRDGWIGICHRRTSTSSSARQPIADRQSISKTRISLVLNPFVEIAGTGPYAIDTRRFSHRTWRGFRCCLIVPFGPGWSGRICGP